MGDDQGTCAPGFRRGRGLAAGVSCLACRCYWCCGDDAGSSLGDRCRPILVTLGVAALILGRRSSTRPAGYFFWSSPVLPVLASSYVLACVAI